MSVTESRRKPSQLQCQGAITQLLLTAANEVLQLLQGLIRTKIPTVCQIHDGAKCCWPLKQRVCSFQPSPALGPILRIPSDPTIEMGPWQMLKLRHFSQGGILGDPTSGRLASVVFGGSLWWKCSPELRQLKQSSTAIDTTGTSDLQSNLLPLKTSGRSKQDSSIYSRSFVGPSHWIMVGKTAIYSGNVSFQTLIIFTLVPGVKLV